jgi:hypothetical protein
MALPYLMVAWYAHKQPDRLRRASMDLHDALRAGSRKSDLRFPGLSDDQSPTEKLEAFKAEYERLAAVTMALLKTCEDEFGLGEEAIGERIRSYMTELPGELDGLRARLAESLGETVAAVQVPVACPECGAAMNEKLGRCQWCGHRP